MNIFWNTIIQYSAATWPIQILLVVTAVVVLYLLVERPSRNGTIIAKSYPIFLYIWIVMTYYAIYCAERNYSILLDIHRGILTLAWIKDLLEDDTQFIFKDKFKPLGTFVLLFSLVYPLTSTTRGLSFSYITTSVMPCTIVIYTIGLLLFSMSRVNIFIVLLLLNWAMVGATKIWSFGILEDFIPVLTAILTLYILPHEYFTLDLHQDSEPQAKYINALLTLVRIGVCTALYCALFAQIPRDI